MCQSHPCPRQLAASVLRGLPVAGQWAHLVGQLAVVPLHGAYDGSSV